MDIFNNLNWNIKPHDVLKTYQRGELHDGSVYIKMQIFDIESQVIFSFSKFRKQLLKIELIIPFDLFLKSKPGSQVINFFSIFDKIEQNFGKPIEAVNLPRRDEGIDTININKLTMAIWQLQGGKLIHTFKDHWGITPHTYISKK